MESAEGRINPASASKQLVRFYGPKHIGSKRLGTKLLRTETQHNQGELNANGVLVTFIPSKDEHRVRFPVCVNGTWLLKRSLIA